MEKIQIIHDPIHIGEGHSSKGNQRKWLQDSFWYKADAFGYESLTEVLCSGLLQHVSGCQAVQYQPVEILEKERSYRGCRSYNFRKEGEELIPLEKLFRAYTGFGLANMLSRIGDTKEKIRYTVDFVQQVTGISEFGSYLTLLLEMDAFFLNEDRHTNNLAVLYHAEKEQYRLCPVFDMGLSLFSDTKEAYPLSNNFEVCRKNIQAKPFHTDFDEQMDAANELYGSLLKFPFEARKIEKETEKILTQYEMSSDISLYQKEEIDRCIEVLRNQARKYSHFFA